MRLIGDYASPALAAAAEAGGAAGRGLGIAGAGVADRVSDGLQRVKERTSTAVTRAKDAYDQGAYSKLAADLGCMIQEKADMAVLQAAGFGAKGLEARRRARVEAISMLFQLSTPIRAKVMLALRESVKELALADPDMWGVARRRFSDAIDLFWDDLTVYIEGAVSDARDQVTNKAADHAALATLGQASFCCSPSWLRAKLLYHFLPFDLSIFGQVKDPLFWIITFVSIVPYFGIRVLFFSLVLLCIVAGCPPDEYQLVQFILMFKGAQFISSGVCLATVAAVKYYLCVNPGGTHTCDTQGPGVDQDLTTGGIDFLGSCILVWLAFLLLPRSTNSAGLRDIPSSPEEESREAPAASGCICSHQYDPNRGGRLAGLLGYDLLAFLLSSCLLVTLSYASAMKSEEESLGEILHDKEAMLDELGRWEFRSGIYFARIFYALFSFPFLVFYLPILNSILTHTVPTGYNLQGLCVPYMLRPMPAESVEDASELPKDA